MEPDVPSTTGDIARMLKSGDPQDVERALDELDLQWEIGEPVAAPMPTADDLECLGPSLPDEVASRFVRLLDRYEDFVPSPSRWDVERQMALAAARYAPSSLALEVSLVLKSSRDPGASVERALEAVAERGVRPGEVENATAFVSYLLAGDATVRGATLAALSSWGARPDLASVRDGVLAELEDHEAARLR